MQLPVCVRYIRTISPLPFLMPRFTFKGATILNWHVVAITRGLVWPAKGMDDGQFFVQNGLNPIAFGIAPRREADT